MSAARGARLPRRPRRAALALRELGGVALAARRLARAALGAAPCAGARGRARARGPRGTRPGRGGAAAAAARRCRRPRSRAARRWSGRSPGWRWRGRAAGRWRGCCAPAASATGAAVDEGVRAGWRSRWPTPSAAATRCAARSARRRAGLGGAAGHELRRTRAELEAGAPPTTRSRPCALRVRSPRIDTLVAACVLQRRAGGDLARLLRECARAFEEQARLEDEVRAATAQARFTGLLVVLLPLGGALLAELASPGWFAGLLELVPDRLAGGHRAGAAGGGGGADPPAGRVRS